MNKLEMKIFLEIFELRTWRIFPIEKLLFFCEFWTFLRSWKIVVELCLDGIDILANEDTGHRRQPQKKYFQNKNSKIKQI